MLKIKPIVVIAALLFTVTLMIPSLLVLPFSEEKASGKLEEDVKEEEAPVVKPTGPAVEVAVYRTQQKLLENIPLEDYIVGVVASEMPADFEMEALKAQALTARTYIVRQLLAEERVGIPEGAHVTDTVHHQVYKSDAELKEIWGAKDYKWKIDKIKKAVQATSGQILTYEGAPIDATFFSTSNGYTESSGDIWPNQYPYLKSVESPWDVESPKYKGQEVFTVSEFESKLGVKLSSNGTIGTIIEKTDGNRVGKVDINGKVLTGKEIRESLGLKSTDFTWERKGNNIVVNTKGYGHGVGMSQYGANFMAVEGKTYQEIVQHYYQGIQLASSADFLTKIMAQK
ncbi:stage II sporulation protein D [Cytobacillus sp. FJAT-54145]|uniref:Stage II sporulation protein D n=1 Tax=Cytobacillus spartinae TaxID=3299023 RepID=A0ABW6KG56_9BACI